MNNQPLHRTLGLALVTFYGLGTIIGAGIYVLVGEVARSAGTLLPAAFLLAGIIALLTGSCYAELSGRYPHAAGAVLYVDEAFSSPLVSQLTGLLVLVTGIVSAAAISRGFVGYLDIYWKIPPSYTIVALGALMGLVASKGIKESALLISAITLLEVAGVLLVIGFTVIGDPVTQLPQSVVPFAPTPIIAGAFIAFYAFIGFEDMVNLAEETRDPGITMPRAILISIAVSTLLYIAVAVAATFYVDLVQLADSGSPLVLMVSGNTWAVNLVTLIGMVAITNGALTQIIMASRMLYGMAGRGLLPHFFRHVNSRTQTPSRNTWLVTLVIIGFALWLPVLTLAKLTSTVMLVIFAGVNLALIRIRHTQRGPATLTFKVWPWVPWLALAVNLYLLGYLLWAMQ
jgi:APA family basic amino acid/polyamine antiporter